jgi:hypothetical protein
MLNCYNSGVLKNVFLFHFEMEGNWESMSPYLRSFWNCALLWRSLRPAPFPLMCSLPCCLSAHILIHPWDWETKALVMSFAKALLASLLALQFYSYFYCFFVSIFLVFYCVPFLQLFCSFSAYCSYSIVQLWNSHKSCACTYLR